MRSLSSVFPDIRSTSNSLKSSWPSRPAFRSTSVYASPALSSRAWMRPPEARHVWAIGSFQACSSGEKRWQPFEDEDVLNRLADQLAGFLKKLHRIPVREA